MTGAKLLDYWSPSDDAGAPVACLATTFTFEAEFFAQDCLSRFLSLSTVAGEGDKISSIVAVLEEEDRLSETQVSVLVDRSSPSEKRNLRWDVLPVAVPGGLLHAKVAALLWERSARIVLGSANLTSAGYRRQVELALTIDLDETCRVPRSVLNDLVTEFRHLVGLVPGSTSGPKGRALATIDLLGARVEALDLPITAGRDLRLAVAPARPGMSPLDRLPDVWRGGQPLRATMLSPFWDDNVPAPAVEAVRGLLTGRPANRRRMTLVAAVDPFTGSVQAPVSLGSQPAAKLMAFCPPDSELRSLHAKLLLVESDGWLAGLIGSSNATRAGLGLDRQRGHHELNLWIGCPATSRTAKHLRALARIGERIELGDERWEPVVDEDEPTAPLLPLGFVSCTLDAGTPARALLELDPDGLPTVWHVTTPAGHVVLTAEAWCTESSPRSPAVSLPDEPLPSFLLVVWDADGESYQATWTANVEDRSTLPPPAELAKLPVDLLIAALASTRPLPVALEHELRRQEQAGKHDDRVDLDPLHRFDDSGLLLKRARHLSLALWRLQERLGRPVTSLDALHWRLHGAFGPLAIVDGLISAAHEQQTLPGEAHFFLAELALTIAAVDWSKVAIGVDKKSVRSLVSGALSEIDDKCRALPPAPDASLENYVRDALKKAQRWTGV
jgi:hypothetical protein